MHPIPQGYKRVADGDFIQAEDIALGAIKSVCGQSTYGWSRVAARLVGQEFYEGALELGHPKLLARASASRSTHNNK